MQRVSSTSRAVEHQRALGSTRLSISAPRPVTVVRSSLADSNVLASSGNSTTPEVKPQASTAAASDSGVATGKHGFPKMNRRQQLISLTGATVAFFGCPCCNSLVGAGPAKAVGWSYDPSPAAGFGAQNWPGVCTVGKKQSPINIPVGDGPHSTSKRVGDLAFRYKNSVVQRIFASNPGHGSMQINFSSGKVCRINGQQYDLLQFHFHTPSEHALDGKRYAMEAHLVHRNKQTGSLAVVGIMLDHGGPINPCLEVGLKNSPKPGQEIPLSIPVDPMMLLPPPNTNGRRSFIHYPGSLTTPPCSEGVDWFVMTQPIKVDSTQILDFMRFAGENRTYGQNSRPVLPLQGRVIDYKL
eukprot:CAMPEP_0202895064 /NCGR_PEP_ID=MMETSP1392-20130828/4344_1 /ASSEMBLY_ACC=CAM_ASM_000868 /TAXON_ID=225041 /ORGANISM="Chlamydomonas chlamydogama, Strain SAG 11-48b" /LENGTH=353 /DNA_ID=CAMNT_0049579953 /DNA_START=38 /DNA_END=1099 /DNA_ORIENTATION=-